MIVNDSLLSAVPASVDSLLVSWVFRCFPSSPSRSGFLECSVATCYSYGLISTVYTTTGDELVHIPELYQAFMNYKRVTKGQLFYIRFYSAPAEILFDEIKQVITVIKIGMTKDYIIPEEITKQPIIQKNEIPDFYANKRIIGLSTILAELSNAYDETNYIWKYPFILW